MPAVLITGGAQRVGAALSRAFASWGYDVAIHYNGSAEAAEDLARELGKMDVNVLTFQADLGDAQQTEALIGKVVKSLPALSCLVNNASLFIYDEGKTFTADTWDRQMNVNVRAPALLARDFAKHIDDHHGLDDPSIINILDQKVFNPKPEFFSYSASKCALDRLNQLLAIDLAPAIRVNGVAPGLTLPSGAQTQEQFDISHKKTMLGRGSTVDAIVRAVKYLTEEDVVTGQVIFVDGGERFSQRRDYSELIEPQDT